MGFFQPTIIAAPPGHILKSSTALSKKLFIKTHGCQMNEYDSARMLDLLGESHQSGGHDVPARGRM
jgi:hypothetical protein